MSAIPPLLRKCIIKLLATPKNPKNFFAKKSLCIVKLDALGDFVLALSAIRCLVQNIGEENSTLVINDSNVELAKREFPNCEIIGIPWIGDSLVSNLLPTYRRFRSLLSMRSFESLVCLRHYASDQQYLITSWIKHQKTFALVNKNPWELTCLKRKQIKNDIDSGAQKTFLCQEIEYHRGLVSQYINRYVSEEEILPSLSTFPTTLGNTLVISPFGSAAQRDLNASHILPALKIAARKFKNAMLIGSTSQKNKINELRNKLLIDSPINIETVLTKDLPTFIEFIAQAGLVLTTETSTAHIATALDKSSLIFIGGGHYGTFGPWRKSSRQKWINHHLDCYGCGWNCSFDNTRCLAEISPTLIATATERVLSNMAIR